ncbi:GPW/gp25 family protein [Mucilaginibacter flavus]|uniref:GPW/gp25 family protein n=1 Tax=Mucilaginibacter flavus TaxID=931504 RepID=UPI0025B405B5|nr:GPW/gp25 family protein [Mucilaginibacter flavus]MDN3581252.1 GPW/gp25 family protein [Mucilaginibacter flavus]
MATTNQTFLGTGWSFPPTFRRETATVDMLANEADVQSSIQIIISTLNGERVMLPNFGCNLQPYVFDVMVAPTIAMVQKIVNDALVYNEPRIIVESVTAVPDQNNGVLNIDVQYTIITTNTRYNYVYPFYINEATNIST